jgi:predicted TIM-barrel fold metal-dependent hydrolase
LRQGSPRRRDIARTPAHPDRFVTLASVALQYPDLAVQQLEDGVKKLGLRGAAVGASVSGDEFSDPKFHPFWAKPDQLGVLVFIHPQSRRTSPSGSRATAGCQTSSATRSTPPSRSRT